MVELLAVKGADVNAHNAEGARRWRMPRSRATWKSPGYCWIAGRASTRRTPRAPRRCTTRRWAGIARWRRCCSTGGRRSTRATTRARRRCITRLRGDGHVTMERWRNMPARPAVDHRHRRKTHVVHGRLWRTTGSPSPSDIRARSHVLPQAIGRDEERPPAEPRLESHGPGRALAQERLDGLPSREAPRRRAAAEHPGFAVPHARAHDAAVVPDLDDDGGGEADPRAGHLVIDAAEPPGPIRGHAPVLVGGGGTADGLRRVGPSRGRRRRRRQRRRGCGRASGSRRSRPAIRNLRSTEEEEEDQH